jgi:hypothetical protein
LRTIEKYKIFFPRERYRNIQKSAFEELFGGRGGIVGNELFISLKINLHKLFLI